MVCWCDGVAFRIQESGGEEALFSLVFSATGDYFIIVGVRRTGENFRAEEWPSVSVQWSSPTDLPIDQVRRNL